VCRCWPYYAAPTELSAIWIPITIKILLLRSTISVFQMGQTPGASVPARGGALLVTPSLSKRTGSFVGHWRRLRRAQSSRSGRRKHLPSKLLARLRHRLRDTGPGALQVNNSHQSFKPKNQNGFNRRLRRLHGYNRLRLSMP